MLTKKQKDEIRRDQGWECPLCRRSIKSGSHIHHKDGNKNNNKRSNLIAIHKKCHDKITPRPGRPKRKSPFAW